MGEVVALSIGKGKTFTWKDKNIQSAIGKEKVTEAILTFDGFVGDGVVNTAFHGGKERAVCYYPFEHYQKWEKEFKITMNPPAFGENICGTEFTEKNTYIGDIFSLGEAIVQVTQGRVPCSTISKYNNVDAFLSRIVETCYTGYFLKVIKEGKVSNHSTFQLVDRLQEKVSVWDATKVMLLDRKNKEAMLSILQIEQLAEDWKNRYKTALAKLK
ncbi:MOSC domain-containing protein [Niallia sp.]|uniref:MOSC domain-containing protein n=1 Tax=Niallia sp. TaxID=2837523 RepID=UPI0028A1E614|nr:MOSC domain-containing protein [Niallia sp.]